jgi:hypothetical protein
VIKELRIAEQYTHYPNPATLRVLFCERSEDTLGDFSVSRIGMTQNVISVLGLD